MAYDSKNVKAIKNGTNYVPQIKINTPSDYFSSVFKKSTVDLSGKGITTLVGSGKKISAFKTNTNTKINNVSINQEVAKTLNMSGFFDIGKETFKMKNQIDGFTFSYQKQQGSHTSTTEATVLAWERLQDLKKNKKGKLFVYDTETYGGKLIDKRWAPAGMTEFAMKALDLSTDNIVDTNILFTNDKVVSDLEGMFKEYEKVLNRGGVRAVQEREDLKVFAMRMSVYDEQKGAKFKRIGNMWQATSLGSTDEAEIGNIDSVLRGVKQFKKMRDELKKDSALINPVTGLSYDVESFIKSVGEMSAQAQSGAGVISGHNIIHFDRPVVDKAIRDVYNMQSDVIKSANATPEMKQQAQAAINMITNAFGMDSGNSLGLPFNKGTVLDTLSVARIAQSELGWNETSLKLEDLASKYYSEIADSGVSHLASHDIATNLAIIMNKSEQLDDSLIGHVMNKTGLKSLNENNKSYNIVQNQVFKATGNIGSANYTGKNFLNFREYANGEIFTNGGFRIKGGDASYNEYLGNTGFAKGGFYKINKQQKIDIRSLPDEIARAIQNNYSDLNSDHIYHASFDLIGSKGALDSHTVNIFAATQEELEGLIGSNLTHVATEKNIKGQTAYEIVKENAGHLKAASLNVVDKKLTFDITTNETEIVKNAIKRYETRSINEAANRSVFTGDRSLKYIHGLLGFDKEARKRGLDKVLDNILTNDSLANVLVNNDTTYATDKQIDQLKEIFTRHIGYKNKNTKKMDIDFRTLKNVSAAYSTVKEQEEYYQKLITTTRRHFKNQQVNSQTAFEMNDFFLSLNRAARAEAAATFESSDKIPLAVKNSLDTTTKDINYFKGRYDFVLGDKFRRVGNTSEILEDVLGFTSPDNMVTFDLTNKNDVSVFANKLLDKRLEEKGRNRKRPIEELQRQKKEAVHNFILDLNNNRKDHKDLFNNKEFRSYVNDVVTKYDVLGRPNEEFDEMHALRLMRQAIIDAKGANKTAGIVNVVGDIVPLSPNSNMTKALNEMSMDAFESLGRNVKKEIKYNEKNRKRQVEKLVQIFGISDIDFDMNTSHLPEIQRDMRSFIKKDVNEKLEIYFDDLLKTSEAIGAKVHINEAGEQIILEQGGKYQTLYNMPNFKVDEHGTLYAEIGNDKIGLGIRSKTKKTVNGERSVFTTNLDDRFGRENRFYDLATGRIKSGGTFDISEFNTRIGYYNSTTREFSKYTGGKNDLMTFNSRIDISSVNDMFYEMVAPNGELSYLLDDVDFANKDLINQLRKPENLRRLRNDKKLASNSQLPPDLNMLAINDKINIFRATLDPNDPNYEMMIKFLDNAGMSLKETALVKDYIQVGDRVIGNVTNRLDNASRPPMTGAGNIKFIRDKDVTKLSKFNIMSGSVFETEDTIHGIFRNFNEGELLTSDFRGRQAYMAGPMIYERVIGKKSTVIGNNINNATFDAMTEKQKAVVYDRLAETLGSGTFEQGRFVDGRIFNEIMDMPIDTQFLSTSKDVIGAISSSSDQEKFRKLNELIGNIQIDENGNYSYSRRSGTIVKKGESVMDFTGYGGINDVFGSKHAKGVMYFSVTKNNKEISDLEISNIINQYSEVFDAEENEALRLNKLVGILEKKGYKAGFRIDNVNQASLYKVLDTGSEKGMSYALNTTIGQYNNFNKAYFTEFAKLAGDDRYNVVGRVVAHERSIRAMHEDVAKKLNMSVDELVETISWNITGMSGKTSMTSLISSLKDERDMLSQIAFGEHGAFNSFISVANDNIPKHGNTGLGVFGMVGEVAYKVSQVTGDSEDKVIRDLVSAMNDNDKYGFIRFSKDGSIVNSVAASLTVNDKSTIMMKENREEQLIIDKEKFKNFMLFANDLIEKFDANTPEDNKLVHKDVWEYNPKAKKYELKDVKVGSFIFEERDGKKIIVGSATKPSHSIVDDGETVSEISQEYIEARRSLTKLRSIKDPTKEDLEQMRELQAFVKAQEKSVKFTTLDDQGMIILERQRFNEEREKDLAAALRLNDPYEEGFDVEKAKYLSKKTAGAVKYDSSTGEFHIDKEMYGSVNKIYLDKLREKQFFDPTFSEELTEDMLKDKKYAHLKEVYDAIVGQGRSDKLGVEEAQGLYDLRGMRLAAKFNENGVMDSKKIEEMRDLGFDIMHISDYVPTEGASKSGTIESIRNKRLILDLGDDFSDSKRYIAIPAGGQQVGDEEILKQWQGKITHLKNLSNDRDALEGAGLFGGYSYSEWQLLSPEQKEYITKNSRVPESLRNKREEINARMMEAREEMFEMIDAFPRKGTEYSDLSRVRITDASQRLKILSVTSPGVNKKYLREFGLDLKVDEGSDTFMKTAKILMEDGSSKSLYNLFEEGKYYDFSRVGRDYFENAGYFKKEMLDKFGFTTEEEMEKYLSEYGTMRTVTRYPQIMGTSIYHNRVYLDKELNGTNFISVAAHSMLKYNGDSDGDSESGWNTTVDGVNYALYERKRMQAMNKLKDSGLAGEELEARIKDEVLKEGTVSSDAYKQFRGVSTNMDIDAVYENYKWQMKAEETLIKDIASNTKVGSPQDLIYQVADAESKTLSSMKLESMHIHPTGKEIVKNTDQVQEAITQALKSDSSVFKDDLLQMAKDISEGNMSISDVKGKDKYTLLDKAMVALEKDKNLDEKVFDNMQQAVMTRVRTQQMFEEEVSKSGKSAIGSVNKMLSSVKQVGQIFFADENSALYNTDTANMLYEMAYQAEQQVISFKKVAAEAGDQRLIDLQSVISKARKGNAGTKEKGELADWFYTYMGDDTINTIWNSMTPSAREAINNSKAIDGLAGRIMEKEGLSEAESIVKAKATFIANSSIDAMTILGTNPSAKAAMHVLSSGGGKFSMDSALRGNTTEAPESLFSGILSNVLADNAKKDSEELLKNSTKRIENRFERNTQEAFEKIVTNLESRTPEIAEEVVSSSSFSKGIGVAALTVAAGLMVAGYAGGGHQRTARADKVEEPARPLSLDDDAMVVDNGMRQQGYVINISADTDKGEKHLKHTLKQVAKASNNNGNVSINMNYRTTNGGGYSNKDIENIINNFL